MFAKDNVIEFRGKVTNRTNVRLRLGLVFDTVSELLVKSGPDSLSIPDIEEYSGVPKDEIFQFYSDKHALLSAMAKRSMEALERAISSSVAGKVNSDWRELIVFGTDAAVSFCNENPSAAQLVFAGPFGSEDRAAHDEANSAIVAALRPSIPTPITDESIALMIQMDFSCLRYGYLRDSEISDEIAVEATLASIAYLEGRQSINLRSASAS
ncbi:TetR/AcrR family transcriptional regulator [Pseudooceanicola atlanticus]|uniref:TetR/AcrR family transcriptional regulator n=1 Tax=Pseudooceanicola atlanticus TaxID=1461694 RepID=UPI0023541BF3|nr:hypothetical protein [Pseudooceanicola atlanticus]